jgi:paraquat-inducible protein B
MSRKANKTAIGAFVVGAAALLIVAILSFGSGGILKKSDKYVLFFDGSIKGLSDGAPVIFRGVRIGNVSDISVVYEPKIRDVLIVVIIEVELDRVEGMPAKLGYPDYARMISRGLKAKLEIQNFITGQLMLAFDFYPERPVKMYGLVKQYPELPTLPISPDIFELMNELPIKEISDDLHETISGLNKLVNSEGFFGLNNTLQEVAQAARSIRLFVEYLEQHPEAILKGKPAKE